MCAKSVNFKNEGGFGPKNDRNPGISGDFFRFFYRAAVFSRSKQFHRGKKCLAHTRGSGQLPEKFGGEQIGSFQALVCAKSANL